VTPASDIEAPDDNAALIGGIVGGAVALLLIGGLIAFFVARSRRSAKDEPNNNGAALQPVRQSDMHDAGARAGATSRHSNYDSFALSAPENDYGNGDIDQNYDAWSTKENNYAKPKPSANRTDYEDFTKVH
jgi:hypothetical protein